MIEDSERQFVDTNVLVYAHDTSAGEKHLRARNLLNNLWDSRLGCVSVQVLQEFYVVATMKTNAPLQPEDARQIISYLGTWHVHRPSPQDVVDAIDLHRRYQTSFWDAMILHSAAQLGCQTLWSEDLNPGQSNQRVRVTNPFAG